MIEQAIGGVQGVGGSSLQTATFDILGGPGDTNADLLALGVTNGSGGATGFKVVISGDAATGLFGTVAHVDGTDADVVTFNGFEQFSFTDFKNVGATNNDVVDATGVTSDLTLNTGVGDDTVDFGSGDDTFVITRANLGADVVNGGAGVDTFHAAFSSTGRQPFTVLGTNLFQTTALVAKLDAANSVTLTNFEVIKTAGGADVFTGGYAAETLDSIDMGNGDDVFGWLTFNGDDLDIDAGARNDTVGIGGNSGSGRTGLINGDVKGGTGIDKLTLGVTNGHDGATGFKVVIVNDAESTKSFAGSVQYANGADAIESGPQVDFTGFEALTFFNANNAGLAGQNSDVVDATATSRSLSLDTGIGNDTVNFGSGKDTFAVSKATFGLDVVDGGDGVDTFHVAFSSTGRQPFTVLGTNLFQSTALVAKIDAANSVTLTNFEVIKTAGGADMFTGGYAAETLKSVDMGNGDDVFGWLTFSGDALDIDAGARNDTVGIGGNSGSGRTGLIDGTVAGGTGADKLTLGVTNGHDGATGFKVVIVNDAESTKSFAGSVQYANGADAIESGPQVDFTGFEALTFFNANNAGLASQNSDHVDATAATRSLSLDTGIGADTVNFGSGKDTFAVSKATFGLDVVDGGAGDDTFHVNFSSTSRQPFTFNGTNFSQKNPLVAELDANNTVTLTNFEVIKTAGGADTFTNGYATTALKSIDMGGGDDTFLWMTKVGDRLDIDAGNGNDLVRIGGATSGTGTGLINGTVDGGAGTDTLMVRYNNTSGDQGDGYKVVFTGDNAGTVTDRDVAKGPTTAFESIEIVTFEGFNRRTDLDDVVDASASKASLKIDTAAGDDTIIVGGGNDTATGGLGDDTFAFKGAFGKDTITDFKNGDMIALETDVTAVATTIDGDTVITTANGWITLDNVTGFDMTTINTIIDTDFFA